MALALLALVVFLGLSGMKAFGAPITFAQMMAGTYLTFGLGLTFALIKWRK